MRERERERVSMENCLFVDWLLETSQLMRVYLRDGSAQTILTCCHTEIEAADPTVYLIKSQYTDSADPITPGAWQGSHMSANFKSLV